MSEPHLSMTADDDLPRTVRRERDAQRAARERESTMASPVMEQDGYVQAGPPATVTDFDVPFAKLVMFFIKAAFAAIPAILLVLIMLWLLGQALQAFFPALLKMKILIYMP